MVIYTVKFPIHYRQELENPKQTTGNSVEKKKKKIPLGLESTDYGKQREKNTEKGKTKKEKTINLKNINNII